MPRISLAAATAEIAARDPVMARLVEATGPPELRSRRGGESHFERIRPRGLARMLAAEVGPGLTELSCHPGHPDLPSEYFHEREVELRTLCDPRMRGILVRLGIELVSYHDYARLTAGPTAAESGGPRSVAAGGAPARGGAVAPSLDRW